VNIYKHSPVTELQVMACIFGSTYAFYLIVEGLMMCPFSQGFFCTTYRFAVTRFWSHLPYFRWICEHLVPNDNFHCQTPVKNAKFDLLAVKNASLQI